MTVRRPCLGLPDGRPCPARRTVTSRRCPDCEGAWQRARNAARPERRTTAYRRHMAVSKLAWIAEHGSLCVGYGAQPPHLVAPDQLGMDHVTSLASGGDPLGPLVGRCAPCNSAKGPR